jgi:MFS family permease
MYTYYTFDIAAWMLIAFAQDVMMIYAGRAIAGLAVGIVSMAVPVYLAEVAQADIRGRLGILPSTIGNSGKLRFKYRNGSPIQQLTS